MDHQTREIISWTAKWTAAFAANLPVAVFFGLELVGTNRGRLGMWSGVWVLWVVGLFAGSLSQRIRSSVIPAAFAMACLQPFMILSIVAGLCGLFVGAWTAELVAKRGDPIYEDLRVFIATVVMGQIMFALTMFLAFTVFWPEPSGIKPPQTSDSGGVESDIDEPNQL